MLRTATLAPIALALIALALAGRGYAVSPPSAVLALAPSLSLDECIEVDPGDTFTVAISVAGVTNLLGWDIYYAYDRKIVEVVGKDVRQFLSEKPNSNVFDLSDPVPNTIGVYRIGAADTGGADAAEDGGGVLAVLTLRAHARGLSWSSLLRFDADGDGVVDFGPTLTATGGAHMGDTNGDGVFDGTVNAGQIAVGRPCRELAPTPHVDDDVVLPKATIVTPTVTTPTPTLRPDGSTPEPGPEITGTVAPASRTATPTPRRSPSGTGLTGGGSDPPAGDGSGGGVSPFLAALIGAGGGAGIIASYFIFRAARRPA
jgi:hypothetical protein